DDSSIKNRRVTLDPARTSGELLPMSPRKADWLFVSRRGEYFLDLRGPRSHRDNLVTDISTCLPVIEGSIYQETLGLHEIRRVQAFGEPRIYFGDCRPRLSCPAGID